MRANINKSEEFGCKGNVKSLRLRFDVDTDLTSPQRESFARQ